MQQVMQSLDVEFGQVGYQIETTDRQGNKQIGQTERTGRAQIETADDEQRTKRQPGNHVE